MFYCFYLIILIFGAKGDERTHRVRRIVGGEPAPQPPIDDPIVYTRFAGRTARIEGVRDFPHYVFRGIRFAHPPVGSERFLRPRQYFLQGFENATKFGPPCVQPVPGQNRIIGNEDCLFLNVFTPTLPTGMEGLPVIIWIHGGNFRYGSASQYGVRHLLGKQLIVVTIQYRLGSLGFLSTGTKDLPGNAALWDMALAVQWTRNYIGFFGGNPHRIVVMGHGTGASSAMLVALGNVAKGVTSGVIAMSGTAISRFSINNQPTNHAKEVADQNGCPTTSVITMVRCLQMLSPMAIIKSDSSIEFRNLQNDGFLNGIAGRTGVGAVIEGKNDGRAPPGIVESEPLNNLYFQNQPDIPLLTGVTKDETKSACNSQYKEDILNKLKSVPHFLDNKLVKNLQNLIGLKNISTSSITQKCDLKNIESCWNVLNPLQFRNYIQVKINNFTEGIAKISEATTDALFNVPAFLTAQLWSKKGTPSFLYRFEHVGKRRKGRWFLKGIPIVGNETTENSNDFVSHGDDLSYIFDPQDINGMPIDLSDTINEEDEKVRNVFTQIISDFVRFGKIHIDKQAVKSFSLNENNFIQIGPKPKLANNFRYCEMALWIGLMERLQSGTCQFIKVVDSQLNNLYEFYDTNVASSIADFSNKTIINKSLMDTKKKIENTLNILNPNKSKNRNDNKNEKQNDDGIKPIINLGTLRKIG